jgi:hypothetical protein
VKRYREDEIPIKTRRNGTKKATYGDKMIDHKATDQKGSLKQVQQQFALTPVRPNNSRERFHSVRGDGCNGLFVEFETKDCKELMTKMKASS